MTEPLSLVRLVMDVNDRLWSASIDHGFGGALALAYYVAEPRATRDMDINVGVRVEEAGRVFTALPPGVAWQRADVDRCIADGQIRLWYGAPRQGIPIDLFFPQHEFHAAVAAATTNRPFARDDYFLPVISAAHLCVFKALFDRPKDWIDIAGMLDARTVDIAEAERWLVMLLGAQHESCRRLLELVAEATAGKGTAAGMEMVTPPVDWKSLLRDA